ncbi:DUF5781 family protein [Natronocalculus amylovorans]|uniref:DUF5781 family protein n=1 Tax=Natronocalculus amylovorans TaxID=2917812 RepID=A0AAE3FU78_9EURY|nr:DUF5781 family protein [Natronocalculus amylovorans]MCL9815687.1 DUF5781 family protein [Natronocalculus amylovorans]NUE01801.1 hypothetical protein [Halorubraceae archaeon YAN]
MDVRVFGHVSPDPFLSAADVFTTEYDLSLPVRVHVRDDPEIRTWAAHYRSYHVLNISRQAATSVMARELALHEYSHMARFEEEHPSHVQSIEEALYLGLTGKAVEQRKLTHCYQIANHMKDIYADDITLSLAPATKLVAFLESQLAKAIANRPQPSPHPDSKPTVPGPDPEITAVNAAFALALLERHEIAATDHRLYDLAHAAADDAPTVDLENFKEKFRSLNEDPTPSEYRKSLVDVTRAYATNTGAPAAD